MKKKVFFHAVGLCHTLWVDCLFSLGAQGKAVLTRSFNLSENHAPPHPANAQSWSMGVMT